MEHRFLVSCHGAGGEHVHELVVESDDGPVYGAGKPGPITIGYTCPRSNATLKATFTPPSVLARPIRLREVRDVPSE